MIYHHQHHHDHTVYHLYHMIHHLAHMIYHHHQQHSVYILCLSARIKKLYIDLYTVRGASLLLLFVFGGGGVNNNSSFSYIHAFNNYFDDIENEIVNQLYSNSNYFNSDGASNITSSNYKK